MRKLTVSVGMFVVFWTFMAWLVGPVSASILSGALLLHEAGHLIVLIRHHVPIKGLYFIPLLGAVIVSPAPADKRWTSVKMLLAGPALGSVGALAALAWYDWEPSALAAATALLCCALNGFNLLPIFPLDGGQALAMMLDDGRTPHKTVWFRLQALFVAGLLALILMNGWIIAIALIIVGRRNLESFLRGLARNAEQARVLARLKVLFADAQCDALDAVAEPLWMLDRDEEPVLPWLLRSSDYELATLLRLRRYDWDLESEQPPGEDAAIEDQLAHLEAAVDEDADIGRLMNRYLNLRTRDAYRRVIRHDLFKDAGEYDLSLFGERVPVIHPGELEPDARGDGDSPLKRFLLESSPKPISPPQGRAAWIMYGALIAAIGAMSLIAGTIAHWSFKPLF
jgi:Zn-dependent protease